MKIICISGFLIFLVSLTGCKRGSDGYVLVEAGDRDKSSPCVSVSGKTEGWMDAAILSDLGCSMGSLVDIGGTGEGEIGIWSDAIGTSQHRTEGEFSLIEVESGRLARFALISADDAVKLVNGLKENHPDRAVEIDGFVRAASAQQHR